MITVTMFKSPFDVDTKHQIRFETFDKFEKWLYRLSKLPMMKPKKEEFIDVHHAPLISPAVYTEGSKRLNASVTAWGGWAALDVDDFTGSVDDIDTNGLHCVVYSTASSTPDHIKFRMVFPLTEEVKKEDIPNFWYALNRRIGGLGDEQVKDLSRMYYIPGTYPNAYNFIKTIKGDFINPLVLIRDYPLPKKPTSTNLLDLLPSDLKEEYIRKKIGECTKTVTWNSWEDCPFINDDLVAEYRSIVGTGWYHKLYIIMVSTACNAFKNKYMITANELANLASQIHLSTRGWPTKRKLEKEAERAIEYALGHTTWKI